MVRSITFHGRVLILSQIPVVEHLARQSTFLGEKLAETDEMLTHERMQTLGLETEAIPEVFDFQQTLIQSSENPSGISISPREKPGIGDIRSINHHLLHGIQFYFGRTYPVFSLKQLVRVPSTLVLPADNVPQFYQPVTLKDFIHFEDYTNSQGSIVVYRTKSKRESDLVRDGWKLSMSSLRPPFSSVCCGYAAING
jgi:hypothetical protein